mgnify:CR=1 FL=1
MHISKFRPLPFLHKLVTLGPPQRHQFVKRRTKTHVRRQGKPDSASDPEPSSDADGVLSVGRNRESAADEVGFVAAREIEDRSGELHLVVEPRIIREHLFGAGTGIRNHLRILDHTKQLEA